MDEVSLSTNGEWKARSVIATAVHDLAKAPIRLISQVVLIFAIWSILERLVYTHLGAADYHRRSSLALTMGRAVLGAAWWSPVIAGCLVVFLGVSKNASPVGFTVPSLRRITSVFAVAVIVELPSEFMHWAVVDRVSGSGSDDRSAAHGFLSLAISGLAIFLVMRTILAIPLVIDREISPAAALATSWRLTRKAHWRLFCVGFFCIVPVTLLSWLTRRHEVIEAVVSAPLETVLMLVWTELYVAGTKSPHAEATKT